MSYNNLTYTIINVSDITDAIISDCIQSGADTLRKSIDGNQTVLKWKGQPPLWVSTLGLTTYSHQNILNIMKTAAWTVAPPPS